MLPFARVDRSHSPPRLELPRPYNAAVDFIDRHLVEGRGERAAVIDDHGRASYAELAERVNRAGDALRSLESFHGRWTKTGDKYLVDGEGYYHYQGRADDMLKVGGIFVSPFEVEAALASHEAVLEAAVVGHEDANLLVKPKAFVVLKEGTLPSEALAEALKAHVRAKLAAYKYPRWIEFLPELPKTATGKIQRFKLRQA